MVRGYPKASCRRRRFDCLNGDHHHHTRQDELQHVNASASLVYIPPWARSEYGSKALAGGQFLLVHDLLNNCFQTA